MFTDNQIIKALVGAPVCVIQIYSASKLILQNTEKIFPTPFPSVVFEFIRGNMI